jgi:hypothetical protein
VQSFSLAHLSDARLTQELGIRATVEHEATALVLAHIAEFDARKLFLPAGQPSMKSYCVHVLGYSDDAARRRFTPLVPPTSTRRCSSGWPTAGCT